MYKNLKNAVGTRLNAFSSDESEAIWYPRISFHNVRSSDDIKEIDKWRSSLEVIPHEEFAFLAEDNMHIFEGSKNALSLTKEFNINWKCEYDYHWYPFDTQTCFMVLKLGGGADKLVSLSPGDLEYLGPEELTQYYVKNYMIEETSSNGINVLRVSITFGRRLLGTILTVYLPTILLNIIGHVTNFFKPFFFEAVVTVNLTGLQHFINVQ